MWIFYLLIIFVAFLQTTFIPPNLVLILIISRSFIISDRSNYIMAFISGIIFGVLSSQNIGVWSTIFLIVVRIVYLVKSLPIFENAKTFIPIAVLMLVAVNFFEQLIFGKQIDYRVVLAEAIISLPIFWVLRVWEDRFVVKPQIRLKIKRR